MRIQSDLCHINQEKAIVKVTGWEGNLSLGSALGEAENAEIAEERAILRLKARINDPNFEDDNFNTRTLNTMSKEVSIANNHPQTKENIKAKENNKDFQNISNDWSNELIILENELKRIGWNKEQENKYIMKLFGYNNRNKITDYNKLLLMIDNLKAIKTGSKPEDFNQKLRFEQLINESNQLIIKLGWDNNKARDFLKSMFGAQTRNELSVDELETFNRELNRKLKET
tara:strand:+ start:119 stop:805 length:687 start_codon:yes stop_codon:yes gene_type:complete